MDGLKDMMIGSTGPRGGRKPGLAEKAAAVGRAQHRLGRGPRDHPRRAGLAAGGGKRR
jgi:hypothetical protein